jgi:hypothetical protein
VNGRHAGESGQEARRKGDPGWADDVYEDVRHAQIALRVLEACPSLKIISLAGTDAAYCAGT